MTGQWPDGTDLAITQSRSASRQTRTAQVIEKTENPNPALRDEVWGGVKFGPC